MRQLLFGAGLICMASCHQQSPDEKSSGDSVSEDVVKGVSITRDTIVLPPQLKNGHSAWSYYDEKIGDVLIFQDIRTNVITQYSIKKEEIIDTIVIPSEHINEAIGTYHDVRHFFQWIGPDTVVYIDDLDDGEGFEYLVGHVISKDSNFMRIPLGLYSNPKQEPLHCQISNYLNPQWRNTDELLLPFLNLSASDYTKELCLAHFNPEDSTGKILSNLVFPLLDEPLDYGFITEYYMVYNAHENAYVLGSSLRPELYKYSMNTSDKATFSEHKPQSKYYEALPAPPERLGEHLDYDKVEELQTTAYLGSNLFYNPVQRVYFRYFERPQELEPQPGFFANREDKECGLMVLNEHLQIIAEILVGKSSIWAPAHSMITNKGLAYTTGITQDHRLLIHLSIHHD